MSPIDWGTLPFKKYAQFSGRAPRAEFWWFFLFVIVAYLIAAILDSVLNIWTVFGPVGIFTALFGLVIIIPTLAVQTRRLHDTGHSGWWIVAYYALYVVALWSMWGLVVAAAAVDPATGMPVPGTGEVGAVTGSSTIGMVAGFGTFIVGVVMLVFYCIRGNIGPNKYGPDPYGPLGDE